MVVEHAAAGRQDDYDVRLAAVAQDGEELQLASDVMKNCRSIVMAAVEQKRIALSYAGADLQRDDKLRTIRLHERCLCTAAA